MSSASRRSFLKSSAAGAAALAVSTTAAAAAGQDRLAIALIGCGGMGTSHLKNLVVNPRVQIAYVCDVDATRLANAAKLAMDNGHTVKPVKDLRAVLDDRSVKAVWIATPDHWHSPAGILAADAGKHVYVEKPMSHNVREGRLLIDAAERNKVVVQVGTQARSNPDVKEAIDRVTGGAIGELLVAKAWNSQLRRNLGHVKAALPPAELDFDLWLGPAPQAPYYSNRVPGSWRFFRDYGAGDIGNDGVHNIDVALWGMGATVLPSRVAALGSKCFFDDDQEWPDTQYTVAEFDSPDGKGTRQFVYEQRIWSPYVQEGYENGNAFYGTKGCLIMGHTVGWKLYGLKNKLIEEREFKMNLGLHHQNFLDAITKGAALNAPAIAGHVAAGMCHLTNISGTLRKTIEFDPKTETIAALPEASAMLRRKYRDSHWAVPKGV